MKTALAVLALLFGIVIAPPKAEAAVELPTVDWLMQFFARHGTPLPKCATEHCTAEEQADRDDVMAVRLEMARAASGVAYDTSEPPLFRGKYGRAMTALRLAAIDVHETGLQPKFVRSCHADRGGQACGVGQVHPGVFGLELVGDKILLCSSAADECFQGQDLIDDAVLMQRVMLHILRTGGLGLYTGEGSVEGEASLTIREWEAGWYRSHPAPATDIDVLEMIGEERLADVRLRRLGVPFGIEASRVCEVRACEVRACEVRVCEVRVCEVRACEVRACEVRACEVRACEVRVCEVRVCEVRVCEVRARLHGCDHGVLDRSGLAAPEYFASDSFIDLDHRPFPFDSVDVGSGCPKHMTSTYVSRVGGMTRTTRTSSSRNSGHCTCATEVRYFSASSGVSHVMRFSVL